MWLNTVSINKNVHKYISPKLCFTPEIKSKYFRIGECVGIGQTTVTARDFYSSIIHWGGGGGAGAVSFLADADCSKVMAMDSYLYKHAGAHQFLTH